MQAMEISRTALDVEWRRLEIIAMNLASVGNTETGSGAGYAPQTLISGPRGSFASYLDVSSSSPASAPSNDFQRFAGVEVYRVEAMGASRLVHEAGNPRANAAGFVSRADIDHAQQMTLLIKTSRAYEANIVAMNAARQMYTKALDLGRQT